MESDDGDDSDQDSLSDLYPGRMIYPRRSKNLKPIFHQNASPKASPNMPWNMVALGNFCVGFVLDMSISYYLSTFLEKN